MNKEQVAIFSILAGILALFAWGRIRYDGVAFMGLILCVLLGLVPVQDAFSGFSHPATITVAMVLILSRGLANSGVVDLIVGPLMFTIKSTTPEFTRPRLRISTIATVIVAGWEKPEKAS